MIFNRIHSLARGFLLPGLLLVQAVLPVFAQNTTDIDFDALSDVVEGSAYSDGGYQVPVSGEALNRALGLEENADPSTAMGKLKEAEQEAKEQATNANNFADTVADHFQQAGSDNIQTASSLANATEAEGVQQVLIKFASAMADLASVSDFFEGLAKGDMSDSSLLENLDSIYEMAKDGESLANNLADMTEESGYLGDAIAPPPPGADISTSPINDLTSGADDLLGTNAHTQLGTLKSHYSDIAGIIDDHRNGKPLNKRALGQLIFRVAKGFAEEDLKERQRHIAELQKNIAAEQKLMGGLHGQLQEANEAKWEAMDDLQAVREAIRALLQAHPEAMAGAGGSGGAGGTDGSGGGGAGEMGDVVLTTTDCPACQSIVDQINQARIAINASYRRIAEIQEEQRRLEEKKSRLNSLRDQLNSLNSRLRSAREGLESTDVPIYGPSQELQNRINSMEAERRQLVNDIGRLEREIEIEEGDPEAEIEALNKGISELRNRLEQLRYDLFVCEEECKATEGGEFGRFFGEIFSVEVVDVKHISGNNPYDRRDPVSPDPEHAHSDGRQDTGGDTSGSDTSIGDSGSGSVSPPPPEPTVLVINNIPIARLSVAGPDACPSDHYHGNANNCDGVFTTDPNPPECGHGIVGSETSIPVSSCPDL